MIDIQHQSSSSLQHRPRCQKMVHNGYLRHLPDGRAAGEDPEQQRLQREQHEEKVS